MRWACVGCQRKGGHLADLPSAQLRLAEVATGWALCFFRLLVLGDCNVHAETAASGVALDFMTAMATLGLSQVVLDPMCEAGHMLDLIVCAEVDPSSVFLAEPVPWLDHFLGKVILSFAPLSCRGNELINACPQRLIDPTGFQNSLQDLPGPAGSFLNEVTEAWNQCCRKPLTELFPDTLNALKPP